MCGGAGAIFIEGSARCALGIAAATIGRLDEAVRDLRTAVEVNERAGLPGCAAMAKLQLARALNRRRPSGRDEAAALATSAAAVAADLGMVPLRAAADRFLAALAGRGDDGTRYEAHAARSGLGAFPEAATAEGNLGSQAKEPARRGHASVPDRPRRVQADRLEATVIRRLLRASAALAALALTLAAATAAAASPPPRLAPPKSYYLALGDSIGYGFQTSKALAGLPPEAFNTGYADLFAARLRQLRPRIAMVNYSCPGESTATFLLPCIWKTSGHALHNDYPGSQRDAALAFIAAHRGQVSPVTLSLNGNDVNEFLLTCPPGDLACLQASAPAAIAAYQTRLTSILRQLRAAAPSAEIIVVGAYDPNLGAFTFADPLFTQLNHAQQAAAATVRARFADPFPAFNPQGDPAAETTAICTLTLLCSQGDGHPSDSGYRALADIVWAASGYASLR